MEESLYIMETVKYNSLRLELTGVCNYQCLYCHASEKNTKSYRKQQLILKKYYN